MYTKPVRREHSDTEPLIIHNEDCRHADLSPRGARELLHTITVCIYEVSPSAATEKLSELVQDLLDLSKVDLSKVLQEYGATIHRWCPIIPEDLLLGCENDISQLSARRDKLSHPLVLLCLWLVTKPMCVTGVPAAHCELYRAFKQTLGLLQTRAMLDMEALYVSMLITVYELIHGLQVQAYQTLAGSTLR